MQKHDTATLNQNALAERLRELQLKHWWVARQIGVRPLTVNRWLTGKVRRIGLENLAKLAQLLQCGESELVRKEDEHAGATQVEQSEAASLLTSKENKLLFSANGQYDVYEQLLRAVMHPNMKAQQLTEVYASLTFAAGAQGKLADVERYGRLGLEYAIRCGQSELEFRIRHNLITAEGQSGNLAASIAGLEDLAAAAESVGHTRARSVASINLCYALRIAGRLAEAVVYANEALAFCDSSTEERPQANALSNCALLALDLGRYGLAARLRREGTVRGALLVDRHRLCTESVFDLLCVSLAGEPNEAGKVLRMLEEFNSKTLADGFSMWPVIILRRAGMLGEARQAFDALACGSLRMAQDRPFVLEEQARLALALGDAARALELRKEANALCIELGMRGRCCDDPAAETGTQLKTPVRPRLRDPWKDRLNRWDSQEHKRHA